MVAVRSSFLITLLLVGYTFGLIGTVIDACWSEALCMHNPLLALVFLPCSTLPGYLRLRRLRVIYEIQQIRARKIVSIEEQRRKLRSIGWVFVVRVLLLFALVNAGALGIVVYLDWEHAMLTVAEVCWQQLVR